jgi:hypothetical protein
MAKVSLLGIIAALAAVSAVVGAGNGSAAHHAPWTRVAVDAVCGAVLSALEVFVFQGSTARDRAGRGFLLCQARIHPQCVMMPLSPLGKNKPFVAFLAP